MDFEKIPKQMIKAAPPDSEAIAWGYEETWSDGWCSYWVVFQNNDHSLIRVKMASDCAPLALTTERVREEITHTKKYVAIV